MAGIRCSLAIYNLWVVLSKYKSSDVPGHVVVVVAVVVTVVVWCVLYT